IAAALCAIAAFRLRGRPRMAAWLAALSGTVIALAMSMDDFLHAWDERYHAVVPRHPVLHPLVPTLYEQTPLPMAPVWGSGHVWIHKPPLPLWLMAGTLRVLGTCELAIRLPSVLLLALCAYATARIGERLLDERAGLLGAAPWQIYLGHAFPAEEAFEAAHRTAHLVEALDEHLGSPLFYLIRIPRTFGELSLLALIFFAWKRREPALLIWAALPYAFFS